MGSVFNITDTGRPFITVESGTRIEGIQFWYSEQELNDPAKVVPYPPTIQTSKTVAAQGVKLSDLTFYDEYVSMDFNADPLTVDNPRAVVQAVACVDHAENPYNRAR